MLGGVSASLANGIGDDEVETGFGLFILPLGEYCTDQAQP